MIKKCGNVFILQGKEISYLMAVDDKGNAFTLSPDPLLETVCPCVADLKLGQLEGAEEKLRPILQNAAIFGVDLYQAGLADKVLGMFKELAAGPGAVAAFLEKYVMK